MKRNPYECWKRLRHLLQRKSLSGKPTSPHMQQTLWSRSTILFVKPDDDPELWLIKTQKKQKAKTQIRAEKDRVGERERDNYKRRESLSV